MAMLETSTASLAAPSTRRRLRAPLASNDAFELYIGTLETCTPLPPEAQSELARRHLRGDRAAGAALVRSNLRLVVRIARQIPRGRAELGDLVQAGNVGLLEALARFDPERGVRFTTYARYWIRAAILEHLIQTVPTLHIGSTRAGRRRFFNLHKARHQLEAHGELATIERLAERFGIDADEVAALANPIVNPPLSTSEPLFAADPDGPTLGDALCRGDHDDDEDGTASGNPERALAHAEMCALVRRAASDFEAQLDDPRARTIWCQRVVAEQPSTLAELGREFGVSKERVRQLEQRVADGFRRFLERRLRPLEARALALAC